MIVKAAPVVMEVKEVVNAVSEEAIVKVLLPESRVKPKVVVVILPTPVNVKESMSSAQGNSDAKHRSLTIYISSDCSSI